MPLERQNAVLDLVTKVMHGQLHSNTPAFLKRPGKIECGTRWPLICQIYRKLTSSELCDVMPSKEFRKLDGILECNGTRKRIIEVDESQHFNCYRTATLEMYPIDLPIAFDRVVWKEHWQGQPKQRGGGWNKRKPPLFPEEGGRHLQRAFRDALADILPLEHDFLPTLRIGYFEVEWIKDASEQDQMKRMRDLLIAKNVLPKKGFPEHNG